MNEEQWIIVGFKYGLIGFKLCLYQVKYGQFNKECNMFYVKMFIFGCVGVL